MGVRSMATFIEARGIKIFIDPGVALAPWRYGLPPHPIELEERERVWRRILGLAEKADVIILTHYHFDHFNPRGGLREVYHDKTLLMKDTRNNINPSQIRRSAFLLHRFEEEGVKPDIKTADGEVFQFGDVSIVFSKAVPHGHDTRLGYVIMAYIDDGMDSFLYTSDVEGPYHEDAIDFILRHKPRTIYLDGPMTYLTGTRVPDFIIEKCFDNLLRILNTYVPEKLIIDHHFMRDINYMSYIDKLTDQLGERKELNILSAAGYMGASLNMLEALRQKLYEEHPVRK